MDHLRKDYGDTTFFISNAAGATPTVLFGGYLGVTRVAPALARAAPALAQTACTASVRVAASGVRVAMWGKEAAYTASLRLSAWGTQALAVPAVQAALNPGTWVVAGWTYGWYNTPGNLGDKVHGSTQGGVQAFEYWLHLEMLLSPFRQPGQGPGASKPRGNAPAGEAAPEIPQPQWGVAGPPRGNKLLLSGVQTQLPLDGPNIQPYPRGAGKPVLLLGRSASDMKGELAAPLYGPTLPVLNAQGKPWRQADAPRAVANPAWRQSAADSGVLVERLGIQAGSGQAAHHIVPGTHTRAAPARAILDRYQIDINAAENGVSLVGGRGAPQNVLPRHHRGSGLHTHDGIDAVTTRLTDATRGVSDWATARQAVIDELAAIRAEIVNGTFP